MFAAVCCDRRWKTQGAGRAGGGRELERKTAFGVCGDVQKGNGQAVGLLEGGTAGSKGNERLKWLCLEKKMYQLLLHVCMHRRCAF